MKAKTRMIVASAVVIAFALTAVSGITYSWFSDTEETKINVSTATLDLNLTIDETNIANNSKSIGTGVSYNSDVKSITVTNLAASAVISIPYNLQYKASISTVACVVATFDVSGLDDAAKERITIGYNGTYTKISELTEDNKIVLLDWTTFSKVDDYTAVAAGPITINTDSAWTAPTTAQSFSFAIKAELYQGNYPYAPMAVTGSTAKAELPVNKVLKADSITAESGSPVTNVVVDFSNVSTCGEDADVSGKEVTVEVKSTDSTKNKVELNLGLTGVKSPVFDKPVVMTMTVPGKFTNPQVIYKGSGENGTVISSVIDGDNTTITFSVTHFSEYVIQNVSENNGVVLPDGYDFGETNTVTDGVNYYATLSAALIANTNKADLTLYCKQGAEVGALENNYITYSLTIYGNGAKATGTGVNGLVIEKGMNVTADSANNLTKDISLNVYSLNNCSLHGEKATDYGVTLFFKDCKDLNCVRIENQKGCVDVTIDGCTFTGAAKIDVAVKFDPVGEIKVINSEFTDYINAIAMKNDGSREEGAADCIQNITVIGCKFTNCGTKESITAYPTGKTSSNYYEDYAASIRIVAENSNSKSNFTTSGNTFIHDGKTLAVADIVFGDSRSVLGPVPGKTNHGIITCYNLDGNEVFGDTAYTTADDKAKDGKITTLTASGVTVKIVLANDDTGTITINSGGKSAEFTGKTYYITTVDGLKNFRNEANALDTATNTSIRTFDGDKVTLCNDLDLNGEEWVSIKGALRASDGKIYHGVFKGTFDGMGHTVSNFIVNEKNCAGFFGSIAAGAVIKNLNIDNAVITSNHYSGGIVGYMDNHQSGTILIQNCNVTNSKITAEVENTVKEGETASYDNGDKVGGITGYLGIGTIENCTVSDTTLTAYRDVGGIAGYAVVGQTIKGCTVTNVTIIQDLKYDYNKISSISDEDSKKTWGDYCCGRTVWVTENNKGVVTFKQINKAS